MVREKHQNITKKDDFSSEIKKLVLYNDEVNSFEFVIKTLVEVCEHDPLQAEQCAMIAHSKGRCAIKSGTFKILKPLYTEINKRGLCADIE